MFKKLFGYQFLTTENESVDTVAANSNSNASIAHQKKYSLFSSRQLTEYISQWNDAKSLDNMLNYY
jgi:hypothetical protein